MEVLDYVDSWISKLEIWMDVCMYVWGNPGIGKRNAVTAVV